MLCELLRASAHSLAKAKLHADVDVERTIGHENITPIDPENFKSGNSKKIIRLGQGPWAGNVTQLTQI